MFVLSIKEAKTTVSQITSHGVQPLPVAGHREQAGNSCCQVAVWRCWLHRSAAGLHSSSADPSIVPENAECNGEVSDINY